MTNNKIIFEQTIEAANHLYGLYYIDTEEHARLINRALRELETPELLEMFRKFLATDDRINLFIADHLVLRYKNGDEQIFEEGYKEQILDIAYKTLSREIYDDLVEALKEII